MGLFLFRHGAGGKPSGWLAMPAQIATQKLLIALMSSDDERIALSLPIPVLAGALGRFVYVRLYPKREAVE